MHWIDLDQDWSMPIVSVVLPRFVLEHAVFLAFLKETPLDLTKVQALFSRLLASRYGGAQVVGVHYDLSHGSVVIECVHHAFPRCAPGALLPQWHLRMEREDDHTVSYRIEEREP